MEHPPGLDVVVKAMGSQVVEDGLPGVAEGGVAQVVGQGDGLGQILVEAEGPGNGPGNLTDLQGVGQPGAVVVPDRGQENLGFILEAAEGVAVEDPVPVALVTGADGALLLRAEASPGAVREGSSGGEKFMFHLFCLLAYRHRLPLQSVFFRKIPQKICRLIIYYTETGKNPS